jgi:two-component system chemotaxis response regulator CheB
VSASSAPSGAAPTRDLVVIGASAGGVEALKALVSRLPSDLPAAVCVVLHLAPSSPSALAGILERAGTLPCRAAGGSEPLLRGEILVAPPDRHLVVDDGCARLDAGPRENGHRPSIDTLFRSAAHAKDGAVVGVVLSGTRDDGAAGLAAITAHGGAAVVQDPDDALYAGMPKSALAQAPVDAVGPVVVLADAISALVRGGDLPAGVRSTEPAVEPRPAPSSPLTIVCPECGGVLSERDPESPEGWTCHIGHAYSPASLVDAQGAAVEAALWTALRSLEDRAALLRRMAERAVAQGQRRSAVLFKERARTAEDQVDLLRRVVHDAADATGQGLRAGGEPFEAGEVA